MVPGNVQEIAESGAERQDFVGEEGASKPLEVVKAQVEPCLYPHFESS